MVSIKLLHSSLRDSWPLFPVFMDRIKAFSEAYESDMDYPLFAEYLHMSFIAQKPTALMIAEMEDDKVVGHMVAIAERWFGTPCVTVVQIQSDKAVSEQVWTEAQSALQFFAVAHDAKFIQIAARNPALARLFGRRGFKEGRILMKRPVEGRANQTPQSVT
jgi:hypothetical protein